MKLIIAGSRTLYPRKECIWGLIVLNQLDAELTEIVSGGANGVDFCADYTAKYYDIPFKEFPANWSKYGKMAGPIRNKEMAEYADALLLIWDGKSKGSSNMRKEMMALKKPVYEIIIKINK